MRLRADEVGEALERLSSRMSSLLRIVGSGGIMGLFSGASAGTTTAMGAGGISGLTSLMAGAMEMVQQLSGVIALLPAVASAAGVRVGDACCRLTRG
jgi:dihydroorotate dehydrogenase